MKIMTKKLESIVKILHRDVLPPIHKKSNYSILAPLDLITSRNLTKNPLDKSATILKDNKNLLLKDMLRDRLFYISHPSLSSLECSINLKLCNNCPEDKDGLQIPEDVFFEETVREILSLANFNPKQIEKKNRTWSLLFKDVAAMKLLNIIFKGHEDHALYPIYLKWIDGSEWMSKY